MSGWMNTMAVCFLLASCGGSGGGDEDTTVDAPEDTTTDTSGDTTMDIPVDTVVQDTLTEPDGATVSGPGRCTDQPTAPTPGDIAELSHVRSFGGWGGYRGSPLVVQLDGTPLILDSSFGAVTAWRMDGTQVWTHDIEGRNYGGCVRADLDGDGEHWVVAGDNQGQVHVWSADGTARTGWPFAVELSADVRSLAAADMDGDGDDEVIVFSSLTDNPPGEPNPNMYVLESDGSVNDGWPHYRVDDPWEANACIWCGGFNLNVAVADLDGGAPEIVFTQDRYSISVFDTDGDAVMANEAFSWCSEAGRLHWGEIRTYVPYTAEFSVVCDDHDSILEYTYSPPLVADIDDDTTPEIIAVPNREQPVGTTTASALTVFTPDRMHKEGFAPYPLSGASIVDGAPHEMCPSAVAADFRGDLPGLEILVVHLDGTLRLYGSGGTELWQVTYTTGACLATEPVVADLDGDRVPEAAVVVSCGDDVPSDFLVVDGTGAVRLDQSLPFASIASPTLTDLDGDTVLDVLFQAASGADSVHLCSWPGVTPHCLIWPMTRGNPGHTGSLL